VAVVLALLAVSCSGKKQGAADVKISFHAEPAHPRANRDVRFHARISGIPRDEIGAGGGGFCVLQIRELHTRRHVDGRKRPADGFWGVCSCCPV
jgi:hypothetical protein